MRADGSENTQAPYADPSQLETHHALTDQKQPPGTASTGKYSRRKPPLVASLHATQMTQGTMQT